jgi:hypothetical protein
VLGLLGAPGARADGRQVRSVDAIVAVVDGAPLTSHQLRSHAAPQVRLVERANKPGPERDAAMLRALTQDLEPAIDDRLFENAVRSRGVAVDAAMVDATLAEMQRSQGVSGADFDVAAWDGGYTHQDTVDWVRRALIAQRVLVVDWPREHDGPFPSEGAAQDGYKREWLAKRKREVCIERRVVVPP